MIKKIVAILLAVSLMCPVAVEASVDIDVGDDGSFIEFAKEKLVIKEGKKKNREQTESILLNGKPKFKHINNHTKC